MKSFKQKMMDLETDKNKFENEKADVEKELSKA